MKTNIGVILSILGVFMGAGTRSAMAQCNNPPGYFEITVWQHGDFRGACKTLPVGSYSSSSSLSPVPNDSISSIKVGAGVRAQLYYDAGFSGKVATYEAGSVHNASASGFAGLGPNVNDRTTAIRVQPDGAVRIPYLFVNDYPSDRETVWSEEAQGLCHSSTHWFITQRGRMYKIPLTADLNKYDPSVGSTPIPGFLQDLGFHHMGDPDCTKGFIFVPLEADGDSRLPVVAVFRGSDLAFINYDELFISHDSASGKNRAGWVAIDPSNGDELWASFTELHTTGAQGLFIYKIDWSQVKPGGGYIFYAEGPYGTRPGPILYNRNGYRLHLKGMQGGVFDTYGNVLYLTSSDDGGRDGRGIHAFNPDTGRQIAETANDYGPFRYTTECCGQEEEGLDFFPTNPTITPGITGQLHAILLNNDVFESDNVWIKHYKQFQ